MKNDFMLLKCFHFVTGHKYMGQNINIGYRVRSSLTYTFLPWKVYLKVFYRMFKGQRNTYIQDG